MLRMGRMCRIWWTFGLAVVCSVAGVRGDLRRSQDRHHRAGQRRSHHLRDQETGPRQAERQNRRSRHHLDRVGRHPAHLEQSSVRRPACVWVPDVRHACPGRQANRRCRRGGANRTVRARGHREDCAARRHVLATARRFDLCRLQLYGSEQSNAMDVRLERELSQSPMAD